MLKLDVSDLAEQDAIEALAYYTAISPALGESFSEKLREALSLLCGLPGIGSRRFSHLFSDLELRTWSLDRFPFRVFYAVDGEYLRVLRIGHEMRKVTPDTLKP
ncbi:MAG: type II toxin-antitoxin system RelE/ParE family toxin [Pseudomonadota bacterium]